MKLTILFCSFIALVVVSAYDSKYPRSKRGILPKMCKCDCECGDNGCCAIYALGRGVCGRYLEEGELCMIRSQTSCGCKSGLSCEFTSYFIKRCVIPEAGSGGGMF